MGMLGLVIIHHLQVIRQDEGRDGALCQRNSHRAIDEMSYLRPCRMLLNEVAFNIFE